MPNVAGVEYPYTPEGISAAQQAERQIGRMGPSSSGLGGLVGDPYISPGLLEMVRQRQQPTFESVSHRPEQPTFRDVSHRPTGGISTLQDMLQFKALQELMQQRQSQAAGIADQYQPTGIMPGTGVRQNWQTDMFGNIMTNQFGAPATQQPNQSQPTTDFGQLIGRAVGGLPGLRQAQNPGVMFGQNPWQRPITQAPRGQTTNIGQTPTPRGQTTGTTPGAGYGSPSSPTTQQPTFSSVSHRPKQPTFSSISHRPKQPTFSSISHRPKP